MSSSSKDLFFYGRLWGYLWGMRILIDCGSLQENPLNAEKSEIIFHCLELLTKNGDSIDWQLLVDDSGPQNRLADLSLEKIVVKRRIRGGWGQRLWQSLRLPSIVKRSGASLFMSFDGDARPRLPVTQCSWDLRDRIRRKGAPGLESEGRRNVLFAFSEKDKDALLEKNNGVAQPVFVIYGGPGDNFLPLPWVEREKAKIAFAGGKEYFLIFFNGLREEDLVNILKAFSLFKKRQQSNMQLVFAGTGHPDAAFTGKLQSYKYRDDIHIRDLVPSPETKLVGGAYALISPFAVGATGLPVLNAFRAGVPVITSAFGCQAEVAGDAALYIESGEPAPLADRMMAVYKDENLRNSLINKGKSRLSGFSWEASVQKVREGIRQAFPD
ncbi:MAG: glycosyltransferase [Puia sp.]|nr:glycosyltransferase [Puia sp.]